MVNKDLLTMLVCPESGGSLVFDRDRGELVCELSKLAYPIIDGIPIMVIERARRLDGRDLEQDGG